jgi:hypothetical protein
MGAGASVESSNGYLFQAVSCGCIFRCEYMDYISDGNVELVKCCYHCLEKLKRNQYNYDIVNGMCDDTRNQSIHILTESKTHEWLTQANALVYANKHKIRSVEEFLYNTNILRKYEIRHK